MKAIETGQGLTRPTDVRAALKEGIARLDAGQVRSSALAAELLLMHALGRDRTWLYAHATDQLDAESTERYLALVGRRAAGEPVQYIVRKQDFWGLEFEVTPAVLIPRPETEHIVEVALARVGEGNRAVPLAIADVGTGSGCLAVALAKVFSNAQIVATDISAEALKVARRNAARHEVQDRIEFVETDLLARLLGEPVDASLALQRSFPIRPEFDLIVSNPPYVALSDSDSLEREVGEHEPGLALYGGPTGVEIYPRLIEQAETLLGAGGLLVVELGCGAADRVGEMIDSRGTWKNVTVTNDLAGIPRALAAERV
ncbi:MAG TPA: peptide chain release factor N(5)-glutamine methyltransferase [Candidatus Acidoferrum sp.]|jgi:release factor glutamine methyltransferase|nr:peptide chain release factor N(5)-glutamine methyltransferase [Candidatus Acidoferrum sp.]